MQGEFPISVTVSVLTETSEISLSAIFISSSTISIGILVDVGVLGDEVAEEITAGGWDRVALVNSKLES